MQYDFLKQFSKRMKNVGRYAVLYANSSQKTTWKQLGFESVDEQMNLISRLRNYGFIVEIDDFGSGYSSLNALKDLDVDVLKIDMGFLEKRENTERSLIILKMIIDLAKSLNMAVITEGVETPEQAAFLKKCGCDLFQGYFFAKPMEVTDFENKYLIS